MGPVYGSIDGGPALLRESSRRGNQTPETPSTLGEYLKDHRPDRPRSMTAGSHRNPDPFHRPPPVAVVGDVHGCGRSLEALLRRLDRESPDLRILLVGDLLTKGEEPALVLDLLLDRAGSGRPLEAVCGNHDRRMLTAILAVENGAAVGDLPRTERRCLELLESADRIDEARELLEKTVARIQVRDPRGAWTVLHAGVDPDLGLDATPDELKWSIKALPGERHWWDRYNGRDGLIVFGHKPATSPIRRCLDRRPIAVNVDTGCVYGGLLTAYLVDQDRFLWVPGPNQTPPRERRRPRPISRPTTRPDATVPPEASDDHGRTPANSS